MKISRHLMPLSRLKLGYVFGKEANAHVKKRVNPPIINLFFPRKGGIMNIKC